MNIIEFDDECIYTSEDRMFVRKDDNLYTLSRGLYTAVIMGNDFIRLVEPSDMQVDINDDINAFVDECLD